VFCSKCGTDLPDDSQFCRKCGQLLGQADASPAPAVKPKRMIAIWFLLPLLCLLVWFWAWGWGFRSGVLRQARERGTVPETQQLSSPSPPPPQLHKVVIGTGAMTISAANATYFTMAVPAGATNVRVQGHFSATGGTGNDIEIYLLDQDQFTNWQNGHATPTYYNSGKVTVGDMNTVLPNDAGTYYLVFNNKFSLITPKAVQESIAMTYYSH
jgi:predicted nucleic acid-binding Zn ribbon protein